MRQQGKTAAFKTVAMMGVQITDERTLKALLDGKPIKSTMSREQIDAAYRTTRAYRRGARL